MSRALNVVQAVFPNVTKLVDAKKDIKTEVTKADTKSATVRNHKACAMAVACKRKGNLDGVIMSISTAYLVKGDTATRYMVPPSVSREIVAFDRDAVFELGEYVLKAPGKTNKLGYGRHGTIPTERPNSHSGGFAKRFIHKTEGIRASLGSKGVV